MDVDLSISLAETLEAGESLRSEGLCLHMLFPNGTLIYNIMAILFFLFFLRDGTMMLCL